jgi:DNA-binding transcriptional LysR family regulator
MEMHQLRYFGRAGTTRDHEETTLQLLRGLEENELDLALISDSAPNPRIRIENLFSEELLLCLPAGHALVHQRVGICLAQSSTSNPTSDSDNAGPCAFDALN